MSYADLMQQLNPGELPASRLEEGVEQGTRKSCKEEGVLAFHRERSPGKALETQRSLETKTLRHPPRHSYLTYQVPGVPKQNPNLSITDLPEFINQSSLQLSALNCYISSLIFGFFSTLLQQETGVSL